MLNMSLRQPMQCVTDTINLTLYLPKTSVHRDIRVLDVCRIAIWPTP
jgi:hypothetical protein